MNDPSIERSSRRKAYQHVILPLFITSIISYLDRVNLSYAVTVMQEELAFTDKTIGFGAGIFFLGYVLFEIPGALIAERSSPKWWIARIMLSWGVVSGLMAFVSESWQFYLLRFLLGAAEASLYPVIYASCIPRWFVKRDRARALAVLLTSLQLSSIIGAPLAGTLLDYPVFGLRGWQTLFLMEAIPAVLFAPILVWWMADRPEQARWLTRGEKAWYREQAALDDAASGSVHEASGDRPPRYSVLQALRDWEVIKLSAAYFLWITGFWGFNYWMPTALKTASGWSNVAVGWVIVIPMGLSLICMCLNGHHASVTQEKRWHGAWGMFVGACGLLLGTLNDQPVISLIGLCAAAIGVYAPFGVWWSYPTAFLSGPAAAGAVGMINSFGNVGGFVGPYWTSYIKAESGDFKIAWVCLACSLVGSGLIMLSLGSKDRRNTA